MVTCAQCGQEESEGVLLRCGGCGVHLHRRCVGPTWTRLRSGPWHCRKCLHRFMTEGKADVTLDEELMRYLSHGESPESPEAL